MSGPATVSAGDTKRPTAWTHIAGAVIAFPILVLLWMMFDFRVWHPELANVNVETTMDRVRWIGVPLVAVILLFGAKWLHASSIANARERAWEQKNQQLQQQEAAAHAEKARREYVLEVIGLGVTYEKYRQGKLWDALQTGTPFASIREQDPNKYAWGAYDKLGVSGARACDALENGAEPSPMFWGAPTFYAGGPVIDPAAQSSDISPESGLASSAEGTGMAWHLFVTGPWQMSERPDQLLEQIFAIFDTHPDLPYVVLTADDSSATRDALIPPEAPRLIRDGYYLPDLPDSTAVFVLARRERVEPLRPYVWDDPDNDYLQENLRRMYYHLKDTVPTPAKLAHPEKVDVGRNPTVAEWLKAAAVFARNPVYHKNEPGLPLDGLRRWMYGPPGDWKPTPWFPVPWNRNQMAAFDNLPSLGYIHRPVFVKFEDEHGQPVKRREARQKILEAGWQQALQTLPDAERAKGPARIVGAFGNHVEQQTALEGVLHAYASQGGPEIDTGKTAQFINTDRRLGNTGAATFFMQMALGVMGSYIHGGTSAAVNLRDPSGASIVFVSPPTKASLSKQEGRDVFKHQVNPAIDPDNYKSPTVGAVLGTEATPAVKDQAAAKH
jgi:hypothetical protein